MLSRSLRLRTACCVTQPAVYEVAIKFNDKSISKRYYRWLSGHHVKEVLNFPGFVSAELLTTYANKSASADEGIVVRYTLESPSVFDDYNKSETAKKFNDKFTATRRILVSEEIVHK
jgi:hypothetical protein